MNDTYPENQIAIQVRYNEIDKQGIAHNSVYYIWFEVARWEFARNVLNITEKDFEENDVFVIVLESYCQYLISAKYDDWLNIEVYLEENDTAKFKLHYRVIRQHDNKTIAKGFTTHAFISRAGKLLLNIPDFFNCRLQNALKQYPQFVIKKGQRL